MKREIRITIFLILFLVVAGVVIVALKPFWGTAMQGSEGPGERYLKEESFYQRYGVSPEGLVLWLDQSDIRSYGDAFNWYDLSGNNNHGSQTTAANQPQITSAAGLAGFTRSFDGSGDYVAVADAENQDTGGILTISAWFNIPTGATGSYYPLVMHDNSNYKYFLVVLATNGDLSFYVRTASGVSIVSYGRANGYFSDDKWHHIVGVYDKNLSSARIKIYLDGVAVASADGYAEDITVGDEGIWIGSWLGNYFKGLIDNVHIYNRALSAAEIERLYLADKPRHGGL